MDRPKRKDFENGNHVGDWLYWEQKYNKALEAYVDMLEQKLTLTAVGCSLPSKKAMFIEELQQFAKEKEWDERVNRSDFSKGFISCYKWITNQKFKVR